MATPITTPVGRIVWASGAGPLDQIPVIDDRTKQQKVGKDGELLFERGFGLAIPKTDASFADIWQAMCAEAAKVCNGQIPPFPNDRVFAWKLIDGDSMDKGDMARGRQPRLYSEREGYGGCWILTIKSLLPNPPVVFDWVNNQWQQVDPNNIRGGNKLKVGDYVQVGLNIDGHAGSSPGLYLNPNGIQFVGFGTAIMRGPDAQTMFGAGPGQLPAGASAAPVGAPAAAASPAMPGSTPAPAPAPAAAPIPGGAPAPGNSPAPAPAAAPMPGSHAAPTPASPAPSPTASPSSPAPAPVTGFATGTPQLPGTTAPAAAPAPAPAPAPAAAPQREQAGTDANGTPYYWNATRTATEY